MRGRIRFDVLPITQKVLKSYPFGREVAIAVIARSVATRQSSAVQTTGAGLDCFASLA
jgi:hypothetical protein